MRISEIDSRMAEIKREMLGLVNRLDTRSKDRLSDLENEGKKLQAQRDELEARAEAERRESLPVNPPRLEFATTTDPERTPENRASMFTKPDYRSMFPGVSLDPPKDFRSFSDFADAVAMGRLNEDLQRRAASGAVPSDGGFSLGAQYEQAFLDESLGNEIVRNLPGIVVTGMTERTVRVAAWDSHDHSSGAVGGAIAHWVGEGNDATESTPKQRLIELEARKLVVLSRSSLELIEDGHSFGQQLEAGLSQSLGFFLDEAFLTGNGVGRPLGILNSACKIEVDPEDGQASGSVVLRNISRMYAAMIPAAQRRAVWLANPNILPELYDLSIEVGTGGSWVAPMREESGQFFLMGRPVLFSEHMPSVGEAGDLAFFDPKSYALGIRQNSMRIDFSDHRHFESAQRLFRVMIRVDGQCRLDQPITLKDGETQVSPVVVLAARE